MNNYEKALKTILETFHAKKVKEFRGHDGYGYNADIYLGKNKIAEVDEDGWGGGLRIDYVSDEMKQKSDEIIKNLPKCKFSEAIGGFSEDMMEWDAQLAFDHVATNVLRMRDFKKQMKKITIIKDEQILEYKTKSSQLDEIFRFKNVGYMTLRAHLELKQKKEGIKILNLLPENEAFELYRKHS